MFVEHRYTLAQSTQDVIRSMTPNFGYDGFGELVFYRTYSRRICAKCRLLLKYNGIDDYCINCGTNFTLGQETWHDVVIRVVNGIMSIRKDWYLRNHISWDENYWQKFAKRFAISFFKMHWMPSGRGLWAMGTDFVYERGSMALSNCAATLIGNDFASDIEWLMDALMHGVGVGFDPKRDDDLELYETKGTYDYVIADTRESWCESIKALLNAYRFGSKLPRMIYDQIRPSGLPIRGFGGISSGPEPLQWLHTKVNEFCHYYLGDLSNYDSVMFKTDLANAAGCCVVAGNTRRSAELCSGKIDDPTFLALKDYEKFPHRQEIGWMSNNSVYLENDSDFEDMDIIASRVTSHQDLGYINLRNLPFGRIGKKMKGLRFDLARYFNPCGEQPLENKEICIIDETCPTMCDKEEEWYAACEYANFYAQTVTLLPTHQRETNRIIAKNRRIGISITDWTGWKHRAGMNQVIKHMRKGYKLIRQHNKRLAEEAGIPESIRVTNIKPGGTVPKLPGKTPGIGHPTFDYTIRRIRVQQNIPFNVMLKNANIPYEIDAVSMNTDVFSYPILQGPAAPAEKISLWEQAFNLVTVQREWADNAVSNTLYFRPEWQLIKQFNEFENDATTFLDSILEPFEYLQVERWVETRTGQKETKIINTDYKITITKNMGHEINCVQIYKHDANHEEKDIEAVLSHIAPLTKSVSLLPHSAKGAYVQMPEEGISQDEYEELRSAIKPIDWSSYTGSDGIDEKFCDAASGKCETQEPR